MWQAELATADERVARMWLEVFVKLRDVHPGKMAFTLTNRKLINELLELDE